MSDLHEFMKAQFEQDWLHMRHLEQQLWRLFSYFLTLITAALSVVGFLLSGQVPAKSVPAWFGVLFSVLSSMWAFLVLRIFLKWRREFVLHMHDVNRIRLEFYRMKAGRLTVWGFEVPPLMGFDSVFMFAILGVIATACIAAVVFLFAASSNAQVLEFSVAIALGLVATYLALFLSESVICEGYLLVKAEQSHQVVERRQLFQFGGNHHDDRRSRHLMLGVFFALEMIWLVLLVLFLTWLSNLIVNALAILYVLKLVYLVGRVWSHKGTIKQLILN